MRLPAFHELVKAYVRKFKLPTNTFVDEVPDAYIFVNGRRVTVKEYRSNPDLLGYPVAPHEKAKTADALLNEQIKPIVDFIRKDPANNWPAIVAKYDGFSVGGFLRQARTPAGFPLSEGAIEMIGVLLDEEALMMTSFIESIRDQTDISPQNEYYEIAGGNDLLPQAFLPELHDVIHYRARLRMLERRGGGINLTCEHVDTLQPFSVGGDCVIVTIPFSALRHVRIEPAFSHDKNKAIRELHYDTSTKVFLQFRKAFWEAEGIFGGNTTTDLPVRFVYYPSHGWRNGGPAVLLASYTWSDDSLRWDSLAERERVRFALDNIALIHGKQAYDEFVTGTSHSWIRDECTSGAFALFEPSQQSNLWPFIPTPDGKVYFAGEHTTLQHAWIEGAFESGVRAAIEVNEVAAKTRTLAKEAPPAYPEPDKRVRPSALATPLLSIPLSKIDVTKDARILARTREVSEDRIAKSLDTLTGFRTRHTLSALNVEAAEWLKQQFSELGFSDVIFHDFAVSGFQRHNVICTKQGEGVADEYLVFCSHFDSRMKDLQDSGSRAPGADDNGSGIAVLLEAARLLKPAKTRRSIKFAAFTGEEQGLLGSTAYAQFIHGLQLDLRLVLNMDMVGHPVKNGTSITIEQAMGSSPNDLASQTYAAKLTALASLYTGLRTSLGPIYSSDYMPFEHYGYTCNGLFDGADNQPFYHTSDDTRDKVSLSNCAEVARLVLAAALSFAEFA